MLAQQIGDAPEHRVGPRSIATVFVTLRGVTCSPFRSELIRTGRRADADKITLVQLAGEVAGAVLVVLDQAEAGLRPPTSPA